jgi:ribosomal protein L37AE/L43A
VASQKDCIACGKKTTLGGWLKDFWLCKRCASAFIVCAMMERLGVTRVDLDAVRLAAGKQSPTPHPKTAKTTEGD